MTSTTEVLEVSGEREEGRETGPPSRLRVPQVLLTADEVRDAVDQVSQHDLFVIDIETTKERAQSNSLLWVGLGIAAENFLIPCGHPKGVIRQREHTEKVSVHKLYPFGHPKTLTPGGKLRNAHENVKVPTTYYPPPKQLYPDELCRLLRPLLFSDRAKLGHNVKFDILSLAKYYGGEIPPGPYHDTILIRHILDESLKDYSLKELTFAWLRIATAERKRFYPNLGDQGIVNFGLDEVARYLAKDLRYCWYQFKRWYHRLKAKGLQGVYDFEMSLYPVLMDIEQRGFPIDLSGMDAVRDELEGKLAEVTEACAQLAGGQFSMSDLGAKRWVLFGEGTPAFPIDPETGRTLRSKPLESQGLEVLSRTPKENLPQVTQAVLESYQNKGNEMASLMLQWSENEKLRGTFVEGISGLLHTNNGQPLPTIHTSYKQHGTVTGRLTASKPNLQQLPRGTKIRQLFVAGPGYLLIVADYDQIELRCLAYEAEEPAMIQIFQEGRDIHAEATAIAMRIALEQVTDDRRQVGKTLNFATGYGAGAERIARVAGVSKRRGQQFLDRYYDEFSALEPWKAKVLQAALKAGDFANAAQPPHVVIPPVGRIRRLPDLYRFQEDDKWIRLRAERQAINAVIQGFASNIAKMAMIELHGVLQPYPARMVVQVHDEIVIRVEESYLDTVMPLVVETMTGVVGPDNQPILGKIPLIVSAKAGYTWASAKGK